MKPKTKIFLCGAAFLLLVAYLVVFSAAPRWGAAVYLPLGLEGW